MISYRKIMREYIYIFTNQRQYHPFYQYFFVKILIGNMIGNMSIFLIYRHDCVRSCPSVQKNYTILIL